MKFNKILISILLAAFVLWIWNATMVDLVGDDATYAYRSLGYFDYLASERQSTPIQWLGTIPWWANLSFHDGPPLVFVIQKIFFSVFGDNSWGAKLPFIFACLLTLGLVYLIGKELVSKRVGYLASGLMAVLAFSTWLANTGFLEGIEIVFIALSIYVWIRFIKSHKKKYLYGWGVVLGLALITKYTAFFLVPLFILYALIYRRDIFKMKEFYLACLIVVLIFTPVIIYNIQLYQLRGHFDAAFSSLFGMQSDDFLTLKGRSLESNIWQSGLGVFKSLSRSFSLGVVILFYSSIIYTIYLLFKKGGHKKILNVMAWSFIWGIILLALIGAGEFRFLPILIPSIVVMIAIFVDWLWQLAEQRNIKLKKVLIGGLILILGWEFAYNLNSNFLTKPISRHVLIYSENNISSLKLGFNKLDRYLRAEVLPHKLELKRPDPLSMIDERAAEFVDAHKLIYFFDDSTSWFAHNWYFRKYSNYYGLPMIPLYAQAKTLGVENPIQYFLELGITEYYFIYGSHDSVLDVKKTETDIRKAANLMAETLDKAGFEPVEIKNNMGEVAFKVYKFSLAE